MEEKKYMDDERITEVKGQAFFAQQQQQQQFEVSSSSSSSASSTSGGGDGVPTSETARLLAELSNSVDETISLAASPSTPVDLRGQSPALPLFTALLQRLSSVLRTIQCLHDLPDASPPLAEAADALRPVLRRARVLVRSCGCSAAAAHLGESIARDLGGGVGALLAALPEGAGPEVEAEVRALRGQMMDARFEMGSLEAAAKPDVEDLVVRVKSEDEDELWVVAMEVGVLVREGLLGEEGGNLVPVLLNRLGTTNKTNRLNIISALRNLALNNNENKERMASIASLSVIVRSLSRDAEESRAAVGLLLDLSDVLKGRQRIGRIQGCIVMLVMMLNGDDREASQDVARLLGTLSSNTQNVLLMAEAGYFVPLTQYLKGGSDMNKILMAATISRIELTDQMKEVLGEEGLVEPLLKMVTSGKLEAKLASLGALRNLATCTGNIQRLINSGAVAPLVQLLFSVTSVLMSLREPASAILASLAQSELILKNKGMAQQMLSLLNLSSPAIQLYLLQALNSMASHSNAKRVRIKMKENGAMQLLLSFLNERNPEIRFSALKLLFNISKDFTEQLTEDLGETNLNILVNVISRSTSDNERAAAAGIISNIPIKDKNATEILARTNLLPSLISLVDSTVADSSCPVKMWLLENISGVLIRFTVPWDKKLQKVSAAHGVISCLLRLLSATSVVAKSRAATSLMQLSQNSHSLAHFKPSRWLCVPPSSDTLCEVHNGPCTIKSTFCLVKADAISLLVHILEGKEREADDAVLDALATLVQDEIWENGSRAIEKASGIQALVKILELGSLKSQSTALWILERIFRLGNHREKYGKAVQIVLIDLAQKSDPKLKTIIAKILSHLEILQTQSSYF